MSNSGVRRSRPLRQRLPARHGKVNAGRANSRSDVAFYRGGTDVLTMTRKLILAALMALLAVTAAAESHFPAARQRMVDTIRALARTVPVQVDGGAIDPAVLDAMAEVPRHELVPPDVRSLAYADTPLSIGHGQTI